MSLPYYCRKANDVSALNAVLIQQYLKARDDQQTRKTHYFGGRYENIYMDRQQVPAVNTVLDQAVAEVKSILGCHPLPRVGFWFNEMMPGHCTLPHTHDDDDEIMSGVYYLQVPKNSGDLLLGKAEAQQRVSPKAGQFVFFSPALLHEVEPNQSGEMRLSMGMNFGLPKA